VALVVAGGWWVAIVQAWPAASRPWIGGSTADSVLELALGYNGLSRLSGSEAGPRSGTPGWLRLLGADLGGQIAWLLPAALVALVFGLVVTARAPRTDRVRGALVVWGGWLLVTGATFSLMAGTFHSYYAVALAPAVAVLVGIGAGLLWPVRHTLTGAAGLGLGVLATTATSFELLSRATDFLPWLRWVVLGGGMLASIAVAVSGSLGSGLRRTAAGLAVAVALAGPASYTVDTVTTAHSGSMPTAGPASAGATGGFGGGGAPGGMPGGMSGGFPGGSSGTAPTGTAPTGTFRSGGPGGFGGGQVSSALLTLLEDDAGTYTWVAATTGSQAAAPYQLATGSAVMAIGGFTGSDDAPTLARFQADVAAGEIHYYISGGGMGGRGGSSSASQIASWVAAHFTATTVGGVAIYDLTAPTS
jgi:4-amino-4-deoxy-L-arabinose transferase-like glycosyltransferase